MATRMRHPLPVLELLDELPPHIFLIPVKKINQGQDVSFFLASEAYRDIMTFLMQLNIAIFPSLKDDANSGRETIKIWEMDSADIHFSETIIQLRNLLHVLDKIIDEVPPDTGPRRFGNVSFRKWSERLESRAPRLLEQFLPIKVVSFKHVSECDAISELKAYFIGGFGSSQRLDYGTGHELSFLAFLGCIWKLGGFNMSTFGEEERGIVVGVIVPYLALVRRLILTYNLEPAGSHGVWGLDDHSFLPYIFGSAQYAPPIPQDGQIPVEGCREGAPDPGDVAKSGLVEKERRKNMYFGAIGFIYDVKTGPFWEHSPTLYDISGVRAGWAKINKGMIKMYNAEVLSKFPVVQHFPFGSLFSWTQDPTAIPPPISPHTASQPTRHDIGSGPISRVPTQSTAQVGTKVPWMTPTGNLPAATLGTRAANRDSALATLTQPVLLPPPGAGIGAKGSSRLAQETRGLSTQRIPDDSGDTHNGASSMLPPTKAPWAG